MLIVAQCSAIPDREPRWGGCFTPTVAISDNHAPFAVIQGPCFFGGCSELCCPSKFSVSKIPPGITVDQVTKVKPVGDHAILIKEKPKSFGAAMREMLTDSDVYSLQFKDPNLTLEQKAGTLGTLFLLDYMFFERDQDMCASENGKLVITLCNCVCMGMVCPCKIKSEG